MGQVHPEHPAASDCWTSPTSSEQGPGIHSQGFHWKYPHLELTREGEQLETTPRKDTGLRNPIKWWGIQHWGKFSTGDLLSVTDVGWAWGTQSQGGAVTPHHLAQVSPAFFFLWFLFPKRKSHPSPPPQPICPHPQWGLSLQNTPSCPELKGNFSIATSKRFSLFKDYSKLKQLGSYKNNTKQNHPQLSGSQRCCSQQQQQNFILPPFPAPGQGSPSLQITWAKETVRILFLWMYSTKREWFSLPKPPKSYEPN